MTQGKAKELLIANGSNNLTQSKQTSMLMLFVRQLVNPFYLMLLLAGFLSLITFLFDTADLMKLYLSLLIIIAALLYCLMSFWQEKRSLKVIKGFAHLLPQKCLVRRQGIDQEIFTEHLVVGDLVWIRNGEKVNIS